MRHRQHDSSDTVGEISLIKTLSNCDGCNVLDSLHDKCFGYDSLNDAYSYTYYFRSSLGLRRNCRYKFNKLRPVFLIKKDGRKYSRTVQRNRSIKYNGKRNEAFWWYCR